VHVVLYCIIAEGRLSHNDTAGDAAAAAAAGDEESASSLSLYSPVYSKLNHGLAASSPVNRLHHCQQQQQQQQAEDYIPRSHERYRHPYWAVESIRQALSMSPAAHSQLTPSSQSDVAAAAGVVASGNGEMRDQATNTDITSECKSFTTSS